MKELPVVEGTRNLMIQEKKILELGNLLDFYCN